MVVDAFSAEPFKGNPAAVVMDEPGRPDAWRQAVAAEFNLSETAFLMPRGEGRWGLRWFTPTMEVKLCGHATVASVMALLTWDKLRRGDSVAFETLSGELQCREQGGLIHLDFPAKPVAPRAEPAGLLAGLGLPPATPVLGDAEGYVLLPLADEAAVRAVSPDFKALRTVEAWGLCVTAPAAGPGADFVSRFFAPRGGVDEDPVTGSAHCRLTPYWSARLGKAKLAARQLSARGGELGVALKGGRVELSGRAAVVARGNLTV
jgi:PhzF family phenazine biosynthesis protein